MGKSKKKSAAKSSGGGQIVVSQTALQYNGPTRVTLPRNRISNDSIVVQLSIINAVTSTAGGVINTVFDSANQAQSASGWGDFSGAYSEYRVLSMDLELLPWNRYNLPTTTICAPLYIVEDRVSATAIGSLATVSAYDQFKAFLPSTYARMVMKMSATGEANWTGIGSTPAAADKMYLKLFSSGNTASTTYYDYLNRIMVQFRNRV